MVSIELENTKHCIRVTLIYFSLLGGRWGLIVAILLATISILFFGAFRAITGISFIIQPFVQMIGGFLLPGKPMANMFFVLFSYSELPFPTVQRSSYKT
jgi:OPT oligopeptide transporter protein